MDIKNPPGSDGWTITYRGIEPKRFEIDFFIWTSAQYNYFTGTVIPAICTPEPRNKCRRSRSFTRPYRQ